MLLLLPRFGALGEDHAGGQKVELEMYAPHLPIDELDACNERGDVSCRSCRRAGCDFDSGLSLDTERTN